ncbi:MAG: cytochrome P450 [Pirellulaceae bacterium]
MPKHPPGPTNFNAGIGLTWRHGLALWWNPLAYVTKLAETYGDLAFFRVFNSRLYVVNQPSLIREVLVVQQKSFRKLEHSRRVLGSSFGNGLILSEGEPWLRQRRRLAGIFDGTRMQRYADVTVRHTQQFLRRWRERRQINTAESLIELTMVIIGEILFHADLTERAPELGRTALTGATVFSQEEYSPCVLPDWLPLPGKRRKRQVNQVFRRLIGDLFDERSESRARRDDLLDLLLAAAALPVEQGGLTLDQAVDEAMVLFHGGYHSSSMALAWALHLLSQHPDVLDQVAAEADQVFGDRDPTLADVGQLRYTEMVLKESMRIYPPAWELFARENTTDIELGGYSIQKGGIFLIYPLVTQRDKRFFPDPMKFDPERFSPEREWAIPNMAYFPFGAGPHACIGKTLAMMEMTLILAMIAREFSLSQAKGQASQIRPQPLIAIRPQPEIVLSLQPRRQPAVTTELVSDCTAWRPSGEKRCRSPFASPTGFRGQ